MRAMASVVPAERTRTPPGTKVRIPQRCFGRSCPSRTCDHLDRAANDPIARSPMARARLDRRGILEPDHPIGNGLEVSDPGDASEVEADRIAGQVMRMPDPGIAAFEPNAGGGRESPVPAAEPVASR